jgi:hypothetical protein
VGLAIPVIAVFGLNADAGEMGLLGVAGTFPFLLFGLFVGVVGGAFAFLWVWFSPVRDVQTMPESMA